MIAFYNKPLFRDTHSHPGTLFLIFWPNRLLRTLRWSLVPPVKSTLFQINQPLFTQTAPFYRSTFTLTWSKRWQLCLPGTSLQLWALPSVVATAEDVFLFAHPTDWVRLCCGWQLMNASRSPLASLLHIKNHLWEYHMILSSSPNVTLRRCWHLKEVDQTPHGFYSWSEWYFAWPEWDGFDCGISRAIFVAQFGPADECTEGIIIEFHITFSGCERISKCRWERSPHGTHSHIGLCLSSPSQLWSVSNRPKVASFTQQFRSGHLPSLPCGWFRSYNWNHSHFQLCKLTDKEATYGKHFHGFHSLFLRHRVA